MNKYFGTVMITLHGWFTADGEEEILDEPLDCASNVTIETEIVDMVEEEIDEDEDQPQTES